MLQCERLPEHSRHPGHPGYPGASVDEDEGDDDPGVDDDALQAMVADMTFGADLSPL